MSWVSLLLSCPCLSCSPEELSVFTACDMYEYERDGDFKVCSHCCALVMGVWFSCVCFPPFLSQAGLLRAKENPSYPVLLQELGSEHALKCMFQAKYFEQYLKDKHQQFCGVFLWPHRVFPFSNRTHPPDASSFILLSFVWNNNNYNCDSLPFPFLLQWSDIFQGEVFAMESSTDRRYCRWKWRRSPCGYWCWR